MNLRHRIKTVQSFVRQRREALDFDAIPDPRDPRGQRWSMGALLSTTVLGLMMQAKSLRATEGLSEDLANAQGRRGIKRRVPDSTLGDALAVTDPKPLREHLHRHVLAEHRRKALEPTVLPIRAASIDGKTNATLDHRANKDCQEQTASGGPPQFVYRMVNTTLISSSAAVCIDRKAIPAKTNDMGVFPAAYRDLKRAYGRASLFELLSMDAGFTSEKNARLVDDDGIAYWMALKGNQPELYAEARRVLIPRSLAVEPEAQTDWELDSSRGWIRRQLWRTDEMAGWGTWKHLRQVVLVRVLRSPGPQHGKAPFEGPVQILEERFHVTNLIRGRLDGDKLIRLDRAHWRVENDFHGALDIQWKEDRGLFVHRGNGLPVMGLLRALAYNLSSLLRAVHLRSDESRTATWQKLRDWIRDALVWPQHGDEEATTATP